MKRNEKDNHQQDLLLVFTRDQVLKKNLEKFNKDETYKIEFCSNLFSAIDNILRRTIMVGIIDIGYNNWAILDILNVISRIKPKMTLIILSRIDHSELKIIESTVNTYNYIQKPVCYSELLLAVRSAFKFQQEQVLAHSCEASQRGVK